MATMKEVAKAAGVSIATVSAVLSGAAFVSPALKDKVEKAVVKLGYARNAMARGLKRGQSTLLGLVVPDITNPFFTSFVDEVQKCAEASGYSVLLGVANNSPVREIELCDLMRSHQVAGTILCPTGDAKNCAAIAARVGSMPLVIADNAPTGLPVDTIVMDNTRAAQLAAEHILANGHRLIAVMSGPAHQYVSQMRHEAFLATLRDANIAVAPQHISRGEFREAEAYAAALNLLSSNPRPTAIFVANNLMLIGVMRAIAELNLKVPQQLSVVSIDDFAWAAAFQPALTVIRQPITAMAQSAHDCLMLRIKDSGDQAFQRVVHQPTLIVRGSCQPP